MTRKRFLSIAMLLCMLLSVFAMPGAIPAADAATVDTADTSANVEVAQTDATSYGLASSIQNGQILQAWCWSYKNIINNMQKIADQGFTAVQVSPIQPIKETTSEYWNTLMNSSWVIYQPVAFNIETNYWNAQGTKTEFKAMCTQAHKYGVKIIVDAVFNHTANDMSGNTIHPWVPSDIKDNSDCWHDITMNTYNYDDRYEVTQYCMMGLPDLNTANSTVQWHCTNLMKEAIEAGADGFRFDAAKHIETPWDSYCASDFWPNVLNAATSYAQSTRGFTPFYYGEVLGSPGGGLSIEAYTQYMSVSDPGLSDSVRDGVCNGDASKAASGGTGNGAAQDKVVQWTESHDNHKDSGTNYISEANINKTWAMLGSKAQICALYLARPYNMDTTKMGDADWTSWTSPTVKAINRFKNYFEGQSEYLSSYYNLACVERGDSGMIIVNTGGTYYNGMSAPVHTMMDGTYKDAITGNTFTVSGGWITGDIGDTGVAVIYHGNNAGIFTPGKQTSFSVCGSFNSWDETSNVFLADTSSTASTTLSLSAGTYTFKVRSGDVWYGNTGTISDTTDNNGSSNPWEFSATVSADCTLVASGGRYKFIYDAPNRKLEVKRLSSSATCNSSYYLKGDFNSWGTGNQMNYVSGANAVTTTLTLEPGSYGFKLNNNDTGIWYGNWGTIVDTTTATSEVGWEMDPSSSVGNCTLQATKSGTYTFTFNLSTGMLFVYCTSSVTATFVDYDGTVLKTESINSGAAPTAPSNPTRTGYTFTGWSPAVGAISTDTTFTAQYSINSYGVSVSSSPAAGGTSKASVSTVNHGSEVTFTATADTANNYSFTNWQFTGSYTISSGSLTSTSITIKPTSAITAVANFTQAATYAVTRSSSTGGSSSASTASVVQGNTVTLSATPSTGYTFSGWTISGSYTAVSGSSSSQSFTIKPSSNVTVKANFTANQSTVKFSAGTGGSVTNSSSATVAYPNSRSSTATASSGYSFKSWTITGGTLGTDYEITSGSTSSATIAIRPLTSGKTISATASFSGNVSTVKFAAGTGGTVSNSGSNSVTYPATKTSVATASTGYSFSSWTVSGGTLNTDYKITAGGGTTSSITIQPITAGKTITATASFTQKTYVVTFADYDGTVLKSQSVGYGSAATAPSDPTRSGYVFTGWDKDFSCVTSAMTVTAQYASDVVYLLGDFNGWDSTVGTMTTSSGNLVTKTYTLEAGSYEFKILRGGVWYGNWGTIDDTTTATSSIGWEMSDTAPNCVLNTSGGTYVFNFNKSTKMLEVLYEAPSYTVTFKNYNGVTLKTESVAKGGSATAPSDPTRTATAQYTYTFTGWDKSFTNVQSDLTVTAQFTSTLNQYTVNFVNYDGSVISTQKVNYGAAATAPTTTPTRTATAQYSYTFKAWDKTFNYITGDTTVTATYNQTVNKYTVTFRNYDSSILKSESVEYGSAATAPTTNPTRPADAQYTYTFAGWDKSFSNITGNLTVTAVYTSTGNNYTVTFQNWDGSVLKTQSVTHGGSATAPATPTRESDIQYNYTFSGWDKSLNNITANTVITAQYSKTLVEYCVVFLDYYGDVISEQMVPYGSDAVAPEVSDVIEGGYRYVFAGWDADYTNIQADTPVFALYDEEALTYTVTFKNYDGTVLKTQQVEYGSAATAPTTPTRASTAQYTYTFKGWDKAYTNITDDTIVTATYTATVRKYTVTFQNWDGTVLSTQQVEYGSAATAPADPTRDGCIFKGWDIDFSNVTTDLTVTAMFVDDTLYLLGDFNNWTVASATPLVYSGDDYYSTSLSLDEGTYEFKIIHSGVWLGNYGTIEDTTTATSDIGWEMIEGADNCTLKASGGLYHFYYNKATKMLEVLYEIPEYVVTFANYDGSVIDTQSVAEGEAAVEPETPTRSASAQYTYSFRSWDRSFDCITEDTLVTAQYSSSLNKYTVTFKDYDGTVISTQQVEYGSAATAPADPTRANYTFTGWNTYFGFITADTIVVAQYVDARTYIAGDFNSWSEVVMSKSAGIIVSTTMELAKGEYEFKIVNKETWLGNTGIIEDTTLTTSSVGWEMTAGTGNCKLNASGGTYTFNFNTSTNMLEVIYKSNSFIVTFVDYDGTILKTQAVTTGNSATAPATPTRPSTAQYTYTFAGWDKSFANIQADTTVNATYTSTVRNYTVKFLNYDGSLLSTQTVEYGSAATAPENPARAATAQYTYTFAGWSDSYDFITQNVNITATFKAEVNKYTVTFEDYDGTVLSSQQVEYGSAATAPKNPTRAATAQYTYTFKEWDKAFSNITSSIVVKAVYTQVTNKYFVTFTNYDGTVLSTQQIEYGKAALAPQAPTREAEGQYTYTFAGWDKDFSNITGNLTVKATFTQETAKFDVVFLDMDGEVISQQQVEYGKAATAPEVPQVDGYVFIGWDTDFSEITAATVVWAEYEEFNIYLVGDFNDWTADSAMTVASDGVVTKTITLNAGTYEFKILAGEEWFGNSGVITDKTADSGLNMTSDAGNCTLVATGGTYKFTFDSTNNVLKVLYTAPKYTVKFVDYNGTVLSTQTVEKGKSATAPADPTRSGYNFIGWDKDFSNITADVTVTAKYEKLAEQYTVTFVNYDGTVLKTETVTSGQSATAPANPTRAATAQYTYTFAGWDKSFTNVTSSITVQALYNATVKTYTVTFVDYDGTVLLTQLVEFGDSAIAPEDPERDGYYFNGWDTDFSVITGTTTVTALYSQIATEYTVTFVNYNGEVLSTQTVKAGKSATAPADPTRAATAQYTYTFTGWDKDFSNVTADMKVTAVFSRTAKTYTVTFLDYNGTVLSAQQVAYGKSATAPANPTRTGYAFEKWDKSFSYIISNLTVTAVYSKLSYNLNVSASTGGTATGSGVFEYGTTATITATPGEGYTFQKWTVVTGNSVANTTSATTTITVTKATTVRADFKVKTYTVTFKDYDGTTIQAMTVNHGDSALTPTAPAREGYTFTGWDKNFSNITENLTVTAVYEEIEVIEQYTVTFADWDGTVLSKQTVEAGESATAPADPAREGYIFTGWDKDFSNITENLTVTAVYEEIEVIEQYTVTFADWDGTVLSTQTVEAGESATAPTAPAREGYTFTGWDKDFSNITEDTNVTACYAKNQVPTASLRVRVTGGTGFTISIDGGASRPQGSSYLNSKLPVGSTVTLTANAISTNATSGRRFVGWMNPTTGVIVSTDAEYTFVVTGNDSLNAVFNIAIEGVQMVTFKNDKLNRVLDSQYYAADDDISYPDAPTQVGFDFAGWSMTEEEIKAAIANGEDVEVVANWTRKIVPVQVTVNGGTGTGSYNANSAVTVVANEAPEGEKFAYWTDAKGNIKSYSQTYKFFPSTDTTVTAVFVAEDAEIEYQILVSIDSIDTATVAEKNVFYYSWYCPEEYTFVKAGILAVNKDNYNESTFVAGTDDANVYDRSPSGTIQSVSSASWTKSNVASGQTWVAKAYVQYKDAQGNIVTVYSDIAEATKD